MERTTSSPQKRLPPDKRRALLLDAGLKEFAAKGFRDASLADIAASAGVTKPMLYRHFANKEAFYKTVVQIEADEMLKRLMPFITMDEPRDVVAAAARAWLAYIEERPDGFAAVGAQTPLAWRSTPYVGDIQAAFYEAIEETTARQMKRASLSERHAAIVSYTLIGTLSFVGQWAAYEKRLPFEETAEVVTEMLWRAITALPELAERFPDSQSPESAPGSKR